MQLLSVNENQTSGNRIDGEASSGPGFSGFSFGRNIMTDQTGQKSRIFVKRS
jgi:hypothetical protein